MKFLGGCLFGVVVALTAMAPSLASANILGNPGFEADAVADASPVATVSDWDIQGNVNTASATSDPVRSGIGSLQLIGGGGYSVPTARQEFPVSPGQVVNLQGYHLTQEVLAANNTFHLFKIVWEDINGSEIDPLTVDSDLIGGVLTGTNPGVESTPFLNSNSTVGEWVFSEAQGTAPPNAASVVLLGGLLVDESAATVYVDDIVATIVPEPTSIVLMSIASLATVATRRRK